MLMEQMFRYLYQTLDHFVESMQAPTSLILVGKGLSSTDTCMWEKM